MCNFYAKYITRVLYKDYNTDKISKAKILSYELYSFKVLMQAVSQCDTKIKILEFSLPESENEIDDTRVTVYICKISNKSAKELRHTINIRRMLISVLEPIFLDISECLNVQSERKPIIFIRRGLFCKSGRHHQGITPSDVELIIQFLEDEFKNYGIECIVYQKDVQL